MEQILMKKEIETRAESIALPIPILLDAAGVARVTWRSWKPGGKQPNISTLEKITRALLAHERKVLHHLVRLHGIPFQVDTSTDGRILGLRSREVVS